MEIALAVLFGHYRLRFCYEKPQDESETVWEHLHDEVELRGGEVVVGEARYSDLHGAMEAYKNMPFFRAVVFATGRAKFSPSPSQWRISAAPRRAASLSGRSTSPTSTPWSTPPW
jgi:hypothetical protein